MWPSLDPCASERALPMDELEPINPDTDYLISVEMNILDRHDVIAMVEHLPANERVVLHWRNATIIARAGTISGWIGLGAE